jgi:hypothetical protein
MSNYPMLYVCTAPCTIRTSPMIIAIFAAFRYSLISPSGCIKSTEGEEDEKGEEGEEEVWEEVVEEGGGAEGLRGG